MIYFKMACSKNIISASTNGLAPVDMGPLIEQLEKVAEAGLAMLVR